jgi:hypothetical protein
MPYGMDDRLLVLERGSLRVEIRAASAGGAELALTLCNGRYRLSIQCALDEVRRARGRVRDPGLMPALVWTMVAGGTVAARV